MMAAQGVCGNVRHAQTTRPVWPDIAAQKYANISQSADRGRNATLYNTVVCSALLRRIVMRFCAAHVNYTCLHLITSVSLLGRARTRNNNMHTYRAWFDVRAGEKRRRAESRRVASKPQRCMLSGAAHAGTAIGARLPKHICWRIRSSCGRHQSLPLCGVHAKRASLGYMRCTLLTHSLTTQFSQILQTRKEIWHMAGAGKKILMIGINMTLF